LVKIKVKKEILLKGIYSFSTIFLIITLFFCIKIFCLGRVCRRDQTNDIPIPKTHSHLLVHSPRQSQAVPFSFWFPFPFPFPISQVVAQQISLPPHAFDFQMKDKYWMVEPSNKQTRTTTMPLHPTTTIETKSSTWQLAAEGWG